jgi:hypothetical protein
VASFGPPLMHSAGSSRYHGCKTCRFFDPPHGMSLDEVAAMIRTDRGIGHGPLMETNVVRL